VDEKRANSAGDICADRCEILRGQQYEANVEGDHRRSEKNRNEG